MIESREQSKLMHLQRLYPLPILRPRLQFIRHLPTTFNLQIHTPLWMIMMAVTFYHHHGIQVCPQTMLLCHLLIHRRRGSSCQHNRFRIHPHQLSPMLLSMILHHHQCRPNLQALRLYLNRPSLPYRSVVPTEHVAHQSA